MGNIRLPRLWPTRTIPYEISRTIISKKEWLEAVQEAISDWNKNTVINLQPMSELLINRNWLLALNRRGENPFVTSRVKFVMSSLVRTCNSSYVGRKGGRQFIRCNPTRFSKANMLHEIGHAIGLKHEHQRVDRAIYVVVNSRRAPNRRDYTRVRPPWYFPVGDYDCNSIMHYFQNQYISPRVVGKCINIGGISLTSQDIATINQYYQPKPLY